MIELADDFLRGSYTPLITPFRDGRVDLACFEQLVDRQVQGGSHGVVISGTTGEPSVLTVAERCELFRTAVNAADGRIPVVAACGSQSLAETLDLCRAAEEANADALLVVTPYYIRPPQRGLIRYFQAICDRSHLPVLVYHIPGRAAVELNVDSVSQIMATNSNLVGMKHASSDLGYAARLLRIAPAGFRLFVGLEEYSLPLLAIGASGVMNAVGNVAPRPVADLCEAVRKGDLTEARRINDGLAELNEAVFWDVNPIPIKYLMKHLNIIEDNEHRLPMAPAESSLERRLEDLVDRLQLAV